MPVCSLGFLPEQRLRGSGDVHTVWNTESQV